MPPTRQACSIVRRTPSVSFQLPGPIRKRPSQWRPIRFTTLSRPSKPVRYAVAIQSRHREPPPSTPLGQARAVRPAQFKLDEASLAPGTFASKPAPIRPVNSAPSVGCKVAQPNLASCEQARTIPRPVKPISDRPDRSSKPVRPGPPEAPLRHSAPSRQACPIHRISATKSFRHKQHLAVRHVGSTTSQRS